jgi:hypothetical protein
MGVAILVAFNCQTKALCQKNEGSVKKLNEAQLRRVAGLLTGHCHLKGHLFKLGLIDDPICERCLEGDESSTLILYDCEAVPHIRFRHLGPSATLSTTNPT